MIKVKDNHYCFIGDGEDLLDDTMCVLHSFLLTMVQRMDMPKEEAIEVLGEMVEKAGIDFIREEEKRNDTI